MCYCSSRWLARASRSSRWRSSAGAGSRASQSLLGHARILAQRVPSTASHAMTSGRLETRRSILLASDASTENTSEGRTQMGRIVISGPQNVSLDGVVQDPDGKEEFGLGGWFIQFGGKDLEEWNKVALDEALRAEPWLLGREATSSSGAVATSERRACGQAERHAQVRRVLDLEDPDWNNSTVLNGDVVTEVSKLKEELHGEIVVPASYQLGVRLSSTTWSTSCGWWSPRSCSGPASASSARSATRSRCASSIPRQSATVSPSYVRARPGGLAAVVPRRCLRTGCPHAAGGIRERATTRARNKESLEQNGAQTVGTDAGHPPCGRLPP